MDETSTPTVTRQLWKHKPSGKLYALELTGEGVQKVWGPIEEHELRVIGGPENIAQLEDLATRFKGREADAEFVDATRGEFEPITVGDVGDGVEPS